MRIGLTGATGFLGGHVAASARTAGHHVLALVRASSDIKGLDVDDVRRTDFGDARRLAADLADTDCIIHCAGGSVARSAEALRDANAGVTARLCEAADRSGTPRLVHASSLAVRGPSATPTPADIDRPRTAYGRAKAAAEQACAARAGSYANVRLPGLYGPGDTRMLPVFRSADRGVLAVPSTHRGAALLHGADAADALIAAAMSEASGTWYAGPRGHTPPAELGAALGIALGRGAPRTIRIPRPLLFTVAAGIELVGRLRHRAMLLHRDKARELTGAYWVGDPDDFERCTGWTPQIALPDGFVETAEDYRARGWL